MSPSATRPGQAFAGNIEGTGFADFWLYSGTGVKVRKAQSTWCFPRRQARWAHPAGTRVYVKHATGLITNDGLHPDRSLPSIQSAIDLIKQFFDLGAGATAITVMDTTFTEGNISHTHTITGYHVISIEGSPGSPGNRVWSVPAGQVAFTCRDWSGAIVSGFKMQALGNGCIGFLVGQFGIIDEHDIEWAQFPLGYHKMAIPGGSIGAVPGGTCSITGGALAHNYAAGGAFRMEGYTLNVTGGIAFTNGYCYATKKGSIDLSGIAYGGGSSGSTYQANAQSGGQIDLGGQNHPGVAAASGGCTVKDGGSVLRMYGVAASNLFSFSTSQQFSA